MGGRKWGEFGARYGDERKILKTYGNPTVLLADYLSYIIIAFLQSLKSEYRPEHGNICGNGLYTSNLCNANYVDTVSDNFLKGHVAFIFILLPSCSKAV